MQNNILILADMEGCPGITDMKQYDACRERMIEEVERVIQIIESCGEADITVVDCHNDGKNIVQHFSEEGYICHEHIWSIQNIEQYDCAMLIGFHPKKGSKGFCPHTIRPDVDELYLGEKSIGEVELLINWLAGHGVPVVFVGGDDAVKKELTGYDGEFYASNMVGVELPDGKVLLEQMLPHIKKALDTKHRIVPHYDNCEIRLRLLGESYDKFVPRELFHVRDGLVVFPDTESFIMSLRSLCEFLNIAEQYQGLRMRHLIQKVKKAGFCLEKDAKGKELINQKDWRALSDKDIDYLYGLLETEKE